MTTTRVRVTLYYDVAADTPAALREAMADLRANSDCSTGYHPDFSWYYTKRGRVRVEIDDA